MKITDAILRALSHLRQREAADDADSPEQIELSRAWLRALPEPEVRAADRVRRRARATLAEPPPSRLPLLVPPVVVLAASLALWVGFRAMQPPGPPAALDIAIEPATAQTLVPVAPDVRMLANGRGQMYGTTRSPRLQWAEGRVELEITPNKGVDLLVSTDEGTARVVGTGFSVDRDAFGTTVAVVHGRVAVDCAAGPSALLSAGESLECVPTRPSALLGRARAQSRRGDGPDAVLATLALATRADNPAALAGEILAMRVDVLYRAGRAAEAVAAARQYLDEGHAPRRQELRRIATAIVLQESGCTEALALLQQAVDEGGTPEDAAALAACAAQQ